MLRGTGVIVVLLATVLILGCVSSGSSTTSTPTTSHSKSPQKQINSIQKTVGINFSEYSYGAVIGNWSRLFNETFYVSDGYDDLVKHYFPEATVKPFSSYKGKGIAVLSPRDSHKVLFGKPVHVMRVHYFGYVAFQYGTDYVGPWDGIVTVFNDENGSTMIISGTSRAGIGAALSFLKEVKDRKISVNPGAVVRVGNFEGIVLKEIGDVNFNGVQDRGELVKIYQLVMLEPFQYYWRLVGGENITVKGGFIRLVNATDNKVRVYIRALGFNVSIRVKNPKGLKITYIIENVNPSYLNLPRGAKMNGTTVVFTTSSKAFSIAQKDITNYTILVFGDHRPPSGINPPAVFLKIMDDINNRNGVFVIDGGDLVYSGTLLQWIKLMEVWHWNKPIFIAVGNHEYQGEGINIYHYLFGPTQYAFSFGGYRFIFDNDIMHDYSLNQSQLNWIREQMEIAKKMGERPVVVMHAPPHDPRKNAVGDDHAMNPESAAKLLALMKEYNAFGIFSHIHMFWNGTYDGVPFIIAGGGGAPLYAPPNEGGFYGYAILHMGKNGNIEVKFVKVNQ